jgi:hypothetical protein
MTFREALFHMQHGHSTRRTTWRIGRHVAEREDQELGQMYVCLTSDGLTQPWFPTHADMFAADWEVTE